MLKPEIVQKGTGFEYDYQDDYSTMISALTEDEARNNTVANKAMSHSDRGTVLIVSDRVKYCLTLSGPINRERPGASYFDGQNA